MLDIFKIWFHEVFINEGIAPLAFLILLGLSVIVVIYAFFTSNKKRAYLALLLPFIFYIYSKIHCGPCLGDMMVMKPMAEKISAYIVKHGIPERLEDIPDLPYRLEGCEKSEEYLSSYNGRMRQSTKNEAELYNYKENCHFKNIELFYWLQKNLHEKSQIGITIKMISSNRTVLIRGMATDKNHQFINLDTTIGSYKNTGICNPMRQ